jgi:hypothetical protein
MQLPLRGVLSDDLSRLFFFIGGELIDVRVLANVGD